MKRICVFCGSNPGRRAVYAEAARRLGQELVARDLGLVYGGGRVGLMGVIADAVLEAGGHVIGVIPAALCEREVEHRGVSELRVVRSMHERKALMSELSDGFIAMPGGLGTLEELFEVVTWAQLGIHPKPLGLLDVANYYATLLAFLDHAVAERFVREPHRRLVLADGDPAGLLDRLAAYRPPDVQKWLDRDAT